MARMHSRDRGKARSQKPGGRPAPETKLTANKIEETILELAKEGKSTSQIGVIMRDEHGVADIKPIIGKSVSALLKEKGVLPELPEDLLNVVRKAVLIRKHLESNKHDETAKRGLMLTESKVLRLTKYHKATGRVAPEWKYRPTEASYLAD